MKERPILFSAPMIRALLNGRKTQTRRIVKPQPEQSKGWSGGFKISAKNMTTAIESESIGDHCPYGNVGDQLWVRETWGIADMWLHSDITDPPRTIAYKADLAAKNFDPEYDVNTSDWGWDNMKWKPSIHMFRWASRIQLEITGVRVERLNDCSEIDAIAEGCFYTDYGRECFHNGTHSDVGDCKEPDETHNLRNGWMWDITTSSDQCLGSPRWAFANLWNKTGGNWDSNPWVWVVEFKVMKP